MENKSFYENLNSALISVLCRNPQAYAEIKGSKNYKSISGIVKDRKSTRLNSSH